jgi:hypothetical protein
MNKVQFVQEMIIRTCPGQDKLAPAIAHAEWLWAELSKAGYGDKVTKPKKSRGLKEDSYGKLDKRQTHYFERFWVAFDHKVGKSEAAEAWLAMVDHSDAMYKRIIAAAGKEARRDHGDTTRKMAQGWLNGTRWRDHDPDPERRDQSAFLTANSELNGIKALYAATKDEALLPSIKKLEDRIRQLRDEAANG